MERKPLVIIGGEVTQLPPGDSLALAQSINNVLYEWDFLNTGTAADMWTGAAISSGTNNGTTSALTNTKHPGVVRLNSTTTANSGYRYMSATSTTAVMVLSPGTKFSCVAQIIGHVDSRAYIGFMNSTTASVPTQGAYFSVSGTSVTASCVNGGTASDSALAGLSADTWYSFEIVVNSASSVTFNIYTESGALHATTTITTNIPTSILGNGVVAFSPGTTGINLIYLDFLRLTLTNLQRGQS